MKKSYKKRSAKKSMKMSAKRSMKKSVKRSMKRSTKKSSKKRGGQIRKNSFKRRGPNRNTKIQIDVLDKFVDGKLSDAATIKSLQESYCPSIKLNLKYKKEVLDKLKKGELQKDEAERKLHFFSRLEHEFVPRNDKKNNNRKPNNMKQNNKKNNNNNKKNNN